MTIASLLVKIGADISELEGAMSKASRSVEDAGKRMQQLGKTISTRVTAPLTALAAVSVRAFGIQEKAELQLRAALQANGREVNNLFNRYNAFAKEMQRVTVIGDETTLAMLSQAESLGLTADSAERAVRNSIAMQSAFGVNAQSALRYTAALEQGNATMLTRYLPALREIEDESERVAKAQELLGRAFSVAEAEAQGSAGAITQMRNALGDAAEDIGQIIATAITPMIRRIQAMAEAFQKLEDEVKVRIVAIAGLFAASGPLLIALGTAARVMAGFATLVVAKTAIISAAFIGIVGSVQWLIDNQEHLQRVTRTWGDQLGRTLGELIPAFGRLREEMSGLTEDTQGLIGDDRETGFTSFGDSIKNAMENATSGVMELIGLGDALDDFLSLMNDTTDAISASGSEFVEFSGGIERASMSVSSHAERMDELAEGMVKTATYTKSVTDNTNEMSRALQAAEHMAISFTSSFGDGMTNVFVAGERVVDVLKNIKRLLASSAIQTGLRMLLTGGVGGGIVGGLFGRIFGVNDALITSSGDVVKFHPNDSILAMKDFSKLGGGVQEVVVSGEIRNDRIVLSNARGQDRFR